MVQVMKRGSTLFLKFVICLIGLAVLALCIFVLPAGLRSDTVGYYRLILLGMYIPAIPFFIALYQALKLLNLIDQNKAFSDSSVSSLRIIKYCAIGIGALYAVGLPSIYYAAQRDDAPGVMLIGLVFTFGPVIAAVFAAVLQNILRSAINIQNENNNIV